MRWTDRQLAMLREMGVHVVAGAAPPAVADAVPETAVVDTPAPTPAAAPSLAKAMATAHVAEEARVVSDAAVERAPTPVAKAVAPVGTVDAAPTVRADWVVVCEIDDAAVDGDEQRLLANMLRAIGVAETAPGGSATATDAPSRRAIRLDPRRADAASLALAVERAGARAVLALGKAAAKALLGSDEPVGRLRGAVHRGPGGVAVVVSWPPSYLLRQPDEKAKAWADLCLASRPSRRRPSHPRASSGRSSSAASSRRSSPAARVPP